MNNIRNCGGDSVMNMTTEGVVDSVIFDTDIRTICLCGNITSESTQSVVGSLLSMLNDDKIGYETTKNYTAEPIHLFIETNGGNLYAALSLVNVILCSKTPIYTYTSHSDSAGSVIFVAGHKRFVGEYSGMIIHQPYINGGYVPAIKMENTAAYMKNIWLQVGNLYTTRTKLTENIMDDIFEKNLDYFVDTKKALELGIATDKYPQFG